jgi:predicted ArsR family transcriptional regulator
MADMLGISSVVSKNKYCYYMSRLREESMAGRPTGRDRDIAGIAVLDEPARRSLYDFVCAQPGDVSRDDAARELGISRTLAGFHLDKLAEEGLLETSFRRLTGRAGPGAGRPAKLYRRSARTLEVSVPARRYELAAKVLADAVEAGKDVATAAREYGGRLIVKGKPMKVLATLGYEPVRDGADIRLKNCPFHGLVGDHKALVCGMNLGLLEGALPSCAARLDPRPGYCCVALRV